MSNDIMIDVFKKVFSTYQPGDMGLDLRDVIATQEEIIKILESDRWRPCNEQPEYDFQNVLVRWRDKHKGCEKDYYIFEGYVVHGIWCGLFEDADISDFEPIEWKPLEPYTEEES